MGEEVGKIFQPALEKNGVKFYMEAGVEKAVPSESDSSKVGGIYLKDGTTLPADRKSSPLQLCRHTNTCKL
jgi:uncharacterized protein YwqG